jgi:hypothetical protein
MFLDFREPDPPPSLNSTPFQRGPEGQPPGGDGLRVGTSMKKMAHGFERGLAPASAKPTGRSTRSFCAIASINWSAMRMQGIDLLLVFQY